MVHPTPKLPRGPHRQRDGSLTLTLQAELAVRIQRGAYAVGERLPTEAALGE